MEKATLISQREIAEKLEISASAVSQSLKVLKEAYRITICNDPEFKITKQFRDLKWGSKKHLTNVLMKLEELASL